MKVGLVLSGGGIRGIGHLGVIKALEEFGIEFSVISGTSAGAMVGAFYAAGYKPVEIIEIFKKEKLFSITDVLFGKAGIFKMVSFEKLFMEYIPHNSFESLNIPLYVTATNIINGETIFFSSGDLAKSLTASACVPLVFEPIKYNGYVLLDGGIMNNFPIEPLIESKCDAIIGIHVNSMSKKLDHLHMKDMLDRSFHFALSHNVYTKSPKCDLFFDPPDMSRFGMFDLTAAEEIFNCCYDYAKSNAKAINDFADKLKF